MRRGNGRSRGSRVWRHPALALVLAGIALLLFAWPFLREPRPSLGRACLEVFAAWTLAVAALWRMSGRLGGGSDGGRGGGDG